MASEIYINIKDLPELSQINNGDYILVETSVGTHTINFENLLLPTQNTVITETVNQNASAFTASISDLSSNISILQTNTNIISSDLESLSTKYATTFNSVSGIFINNNTVLIKTGDYSVSTVVNIGTVFDASNVLITPINKYAALFPAYVESINTTSGLVTIKGTFNQTVATFNAILSTVSLSTVYIAAEEDANYNVCIIKN
jgi:hypothetical protein